MLPRGLCRHAMDNRLLSGHMSGAVGGLSFFCPGCWGAVDESADTCPRCGADLATLDHEDFERKLIRALDHPAPDVMERAAHILGLQRARAAVPALLARFRAGVDPFQSAEIVRALGRIGGAEARAAIEEIAGSQSSPIVQLAVRAALADLEARPAPE